MTPTQTRQITTLLREATSKLQQVENLLEKIQRDEPHQT